MKKRTRRLGILITLALATVLVFQNALAGDLFMLKPAVSGKQDVFQDVNFTLAHPLNSEGVPILFGNNPNKVPVLDVIGKLATSIFPTSIVTLTGTQAVTHKVVNGLTLGAGTTSITDGTVTLNDTPTDVFKFTNVKVNYTGGDFVIYTTGDTHVTMPTSGLLATVGNQPRGTSDSTVSGSGATLTLTSTKGPQVDVTWSSGSITTVALQNTRELLLRFTGATTLVNSSTLILPGGVNVTTAANDTYVAVGGSSATTLKPYDLAPGTVSSIFKSISVQGNSLIRTFQTDRVNISNSSLLTGTVRGLWDLEAGAGETGTGTDLDVTTASIYGLNVDVRGTAASGSNTLYAARFYSETGFSSAAASLMGLFVQTDTIDAYAVVPKQTGIRVQTTTDSDTLSAFGIENAFVGNFAPEHHFDAATGNSVNMAMGCASTGCYMNNPIAYSARIATGLETSTSGHGALQGLVTGYKLVNWFCNSDHYTGTFTVPTADTITSTSHGLYVGDVITVSSTGTLPTGLTANTDYYVISSSFGAGSFKVSTVVKGSPVSITASTGTGTLTWDRYACPSSSAGIYADNSISLGTRSAYFIKSDSTAPSLFAGQFQFRTGDTGAGTAPIKLANATALNTTPEAGAFEFKDDTWYGTNSSGVRKRFMQGSIFTLGDSNTTITGTPSDVLLTAAITGNRIDVWPAANTYPAGARVTFADTAYTIGTNYVQLNAATGDTIDTVGNYRINQQGAVVTLISDGVSNWTAPAVAYQKLTGRKINSFGGGQDVTLSETLDFIGSAAQGDILYRGASTWARLPTGTNGQLLTSGGAGANLSWTTVAAGGGTVTSFSSGNLSPLFTTSVATSTTTPALTFSLSTASAHNFLGNNTGSTAAPAYVQPAFSDLSGSIAASQMPAFTGDVTTSAGAVATTLANIPTGVPAAGSIVHTNIAAPSSPSSGKVSVFSDSTDLRLHDKNASGVIGTTVVADTGASNNFLTGITTAGAVTKAQPAFTNISGTLAGSQLPSALTVAPMVAKASDANAILPVILYAHGVNALTSGTPADVTSITVPASITRYRVVATATTADYNCVLLESGSTTASAAFTARDTASGGGTAITSSATGPASTGVVVNWGANNATSSFTASTIYINQTANSANASPLSFYLVIMPLP